VPRFGTSIWLLCFALLLAACGHKPPYSRANRPSAEDLLATTAPQLPALAVSDAEVTINRVHRADLAMLAQAPNRFRGTVSKAGNELVSLSFHEDGYGLRYKLDQLPIGYYHGPPDPCAVDAMLTVPFSYEGLVALVLGGAPTLQKPYEILDQRWDRRGNYEELVIGDDRFVEELRFVWQGGQWRFTGAGMWERKSDGSRGKRLWDLLHDKFGKVGSAVLPGRTRITAPGKRTDSFVKIVYSGRDPDPPWAAPAATTNGGGEQTEGDTNPWGDGDEGGWEDGEDEGWEDGEAPADEPPTEQAPAEDAPAEAEEPAKSEMAQPTPNKPDTTSDTSVPTVFVLDGAGLTDRGDLCR
jgi:hypothetical protein